MGLLRRIEGGGNGTTVPVATPPPPAPVEVEAPAPPVVPASNGSPPPPPPSERPRGGLAASIAPPPASGRGVGLSVGQNDRTIKMSRELKARVKNRLIAELDPDMDLSKTAEVKQRIKTLFDLVVEGENIVLTRVERERLFEEVTADIIGFGPIEPLLQDSTISEVMVNGPNQIYVEQKGKLRLAEVTFDDDEHVRRIIDRIVSP